MGTQPTYKKRRVMSFRKKHSVGFKKTKRALRPTFK